MIGILAKEGGIVSINWHSITRLVLEIERESKRERERERRRKYNKINCFSLY